MPKLLHPTVHLDIVRDAPVAEVLAYTDHVVVKLTGNTWLTTPVIALTTLSADGDAVRKQEALVRNRGKGLAEARNTLLSDLFADLNALKSQCQGICDKNPGREAEIAQSCGFVLGKRPTRQKATLKAYLTKTLGQVILRAKAVKRGASYLWEYSPDGGVTWISAGNTTVADTVVNGLAINKEYLFRFRATVGKVTGNPCTAIPFTLQAMN